MMGYQLCGWRVLSEVPLPSLSPWLGDHRSADLVIRLGEVPQRLDPVIYEAPLYQLAQDGRCRFEITRVAAYLVDAIGQEVVVDPARGAENQDIVTFLLSGILAVICHRRGLLPLHASCVRIGNKAIAFVGASALGKSILAALFYRQGHTVLADDVAVVELAAQGAMMLPSSPQLAVWRDDLERLGYSVEKLERRRTGLEKYHLPLTNQAGVSESIPLAAIYHLGEARDPRHEKLESVRGLNAVMAVNENMHAVRIGRQLLGGKTLFSNGAQLAASVPVYRLARLLSMDRNQALVAEIEALYGRS
jgi:hypothetical protein